MMEFLLHWHISAQQSAPAMISTADHKNGLRPPELTVQEAGIVQAPYPGYWKKNQGVGIRRRAVGVLVIQNFQNSFGPRKPRIQRYPRLLPVINRRGREAATPI
jgi:hypothetical protein